MLMLLQVEDFTMGYVMDRRLGNTGGLGGAFGLLYAIGCPFPYPEGRPWSSSWQQRVSRRTAPVCCLGLEDPRPAHMGHVQACM